MLTAHRAIGTWNRSVDAYIALSEFSRRKFVEAGLPESRITVKPNFLLPDPGVGTGAGGYAVFVGRLSAEKGIDTLLEAWRQLEGILPLKIVGDGPLSGMAKDASATSETIEWLGALPPESVHSVIGEAKALVLPSRCYETFGRVIIEAFAKGTPAIVSKFGSMAELVEDGHTGLHFKAGDATDLAVKARQLVSAPFKLAQMRHAARRTFEQKFTAGSNYDALMAIYARVMGDAGHKANTERAAAPGRNMRMIGGAR
jgi:glycosyltransferase involved in cell wall biosynthesis